MEFKEHLKVLNQYKILIIILTLLLAAVSFLFAYIQEPYFDTSISFTVNRINRQNTQYYEYDGFYAIQASDLFAANVVSWFMTPSFLLEIYDQANLDPQITSLERFANRFKTKQFSSQNIVVRFREETDERARKISEAIINKVETKSAQLNKTADDKSLFEVVGSKPVIVEKKANIWLSTLIGLVSGFILAVIIVYLKRYFKAENSENL